MKVDRVRCPSCGENLAGVEYIPGLIAFGYNRATATITNGTIPCRCGAVLVIGAGKVIEFAPSDPLPRQTTISSVIERLSAAVCPEV